MASDKVKADEVFSYAINALKSGTSIDVLRAEIEAANRFMDGYESHQEIKGNQ